MVVWPLSNAGKMLSQAHCHVERLSRLHWTTCRRPSNKIRSASPLKSESILGLYSVAIYYAKLKQARHVEYLRKIGGRTRCTAFGYLQ
jgi:hypothetical protein